MKLRFLFIFMLILAGLSAQATTLTFDWKGSSSTTWESSGSWTETGGSGDYPGSGGRTTDIVRFGMTATFTKQPTLATTLTIASIEFGGGFQKNGAQITVNGATLTVGTITQDINTNSSHATIYDYLEGTGTITCGSITVGSGSSTSGFDNYMMADIATLNVTGNVAIIINTNIQNGSGFRLESGNMYLSGQVIFTKLSGISQSNAGYFTINTITQAGGTATTPHLFLSNPNPIPSIPSPNASVNFYGDHGGTGTVTYTAANPTVVTSSTTGFGTGGGTIDTSKANYDNLVIQASGTTSVGGTTVGALKIAGDMDTYSTTTFSPPGGHATNTSVGGNWNNTATVTGGAGSTAISGNVNNTGTLNLSSGILEVGGNITNSSALNAGSGSITVDGDLTNTSSVVLSSGSLTVSGDYTNSATFTAGSGTVYFNGASAEALTDNSTTGTTLNNVDFSGAGVKTLGGTGSFAVSSVGTLSMEASTTLQTGGILTLNSSSTGSASVGSIPSTSKITGNVNVQRYISGGSNAYRGYRLLSSPINTASSGSTYYYSLAYLATYAPITGTLGTGGGLTKSGNPSMYLYRDNIAHTDKTFNTGNFRGVNKINNAPAYAIGVDFDGTHNLTVGNGVMFFYRGNLSNLASKFLTTTSAEPNLFVSTGVLNQQPITVINWYTGLATLQCDTVSGNAGYEGFNLVGNPYASSIDWNDFSATSSSAGIYGPKVGPTIWVFNEVSKCYATYSAGLGLNGGSNVIPSGQGFFVRASKSGASLMFTESCKTSAQLSGPTQATGTTLLLSKAPIAAQVMQYLRLELAADSINKEETIVKFDNMAKNTFDADIDAQHLPGSGEVFFSSMTADSVKVAINTMPLPKARAKSIKLNVVTVADGIYAINLTQIQSIPKLYDIWLMDAYNKDSLDMRTSQSYKFNVLISDTNSYGSNRFALVIRQNPALSVHLLQFNANKATGGVQVIWKVENEQNYTNFTVERSSDGGANFTQLDGLASNGQGTYSYLDKNPPETKDLYRLVMTDLNGTVTYSNVVTLSFGTEPELAKTEISVYPNPAISVVNLAIGQTGSDAAADPFSLNPAVISPTPPAATYDIKIINITGAVIKSETSANANWQSNVSALPPGTYVIQVVNDKDKSLVGKSTFVKM